MLDAHMDKGQAVRDRSELRIRTRMRTGKISNAYAELICDCLVFDRSKRGARLKVPLNTRIPHDIILRDEGIEMSIHAQVRWRRDNEVGVYFPKEAVSVARNLQPPPKPTAVTLRRS